VSQAMVAALAPDPSGGGMIEFNPHSGESLRRRRQSGNTLVHPKEAAQSTGRATTQSTTRSSQI
jgi:hypothetical protein